MLDKAVELAEDKIVDAYEPPAIVVLGAVSELTGQDEPSAFDTTTTVISDRRLKSDVETVRRALERLRAIRAR